MDNLVEYCVWGLKQVKNDKWKRHLQFANQVAIDHFLELNTVRQYPILVARFMETRKVPPGIALQFVSNVKKYLQEGRKS